ncbi:hypothetical protein QYE76_048894 [Lolium multiflorum]|uniref:Glabrous enhancer-binding protein-like DBD domain-containing protein n=1 Tax=Lolium multiflorum TaxID=4521 RepID=A0AAD8SN35_LOLMU|nr:hypothetical protein QYE76_048894 [Lolium multiflorum]
MPPASSVVTTASSASSSDISLPSSPSPSPQHSPDPYAFSSLDEINAAPPAKKKKPPNRGGTRARAWPNADEAVLLEAVAAYKEQHGRLPSRADLPAALAGRLPHINSEQAAKRLNALRQRYDGSVRRLRRGTVPVTDDDVRVFRLSKRIWEGVPKRTRRRPRAAPHHERRAFAELQQMYPCLAAEVEAIDARCGMPGFMRTAFQRIGDEQAAELEAQVKRQRLVQLKADARRAELKSLVLRTIVAGME